MNATRAQPVSSIPMRGLLLAVALSVLAHVLALLAANSRFSFSFQGAQGSAPLDTRMILPAPTQAAQETALPSPVVTPVQKRTPAPSKSAATPMTPEELQAKRSLDDQKQEPVKAPEKEEKPQLVGEKSQDAATESVAITTSTQADATSTQAATSSEPAGPTAPSGLKLQYPANARLEFEGISMRKGERRTGSGMLSWRSDGSSYELMLEASVFGISIFNQKSVGVMSPQGLAPERYTDKRFNRAEQATHFRRELGKIQFSNNKPEAALLVGAQDRLSATLQLAGIIGGDQERYRIVNRITMQVAGTDYADLWEFMLEGVSDINVPAANMQALKLQRKPRDEFDQRLEIWLSPQLGYLPIRIRQSSATEPEQDFTDLVLKRLP
jgi:hypothetical protein